MKKIILLSFIATFTLSNTFAKIWRVNNVAGVAADFTTAQFAHDNILVQAGDTIHLGQSAVCYGGLSISKKLTVISIGDFLTTNPNLQCSPLTGRLDDVFINNINADISLLHCNVKLLCCKSK